MSLLVIGLNHKTANVEIREKFSVPEADTEKLLNHLKCNSGVDSAVVLSTCNRTEFYLNSEDALQPLQSICKWFDIKPEELNPHIYQHCNQDASKHLFMVTAGIDSLVLGEVQIAGQVKSAYETAKNIQKLNKNLDRMFQNAFRVAKLVRSETDIGKNPVSVAHSAVQLSRQIFGRLETQSILTIGAGDTSELVLRYLSKHPHQRLTVCNRSVDRGQRLATQMNSEFFTLDHLGKNISQYDLIFTATASTHPVITYDMIVKALKQRKQKPMVIIDLAIPRDTEDKVKKLNDVFYYTVDDLQKVISENLKSRHQASIHAQAIIDDEVDNFDNWLNAQKHKNLIHTFQRETAKIRKQALDKALKQLKSGEDTENVLFNLANNLTKKLNHTPVKALSEVIHSGDKSKIEFFKKLMKLDD